MVSKPNIGDTGWGATLNAALDALDITNPTSAAAVAAKATYVARDSTKDFAGDATTPLAKYAARSTQVAVHGPVNAIVGMAINDTAASTTAFPTGITGYARVDNAGNQAFGLYGVAALYAAGVATNEFNSFNYASAPSGTYPPNRAIGTTDRLPVVATVASGGTFPSAIGVHICKEGSEPQQMLTGIYVSPDVIRDYPMLIDGGAASYPSTFLGNGTIRTRAGIVAAFGTHLADDATGAMLLIGVGGSGTVPFIAAAVRNGTASDLVLQTNNAERIRFDATTPTIKLPSGAAVQVNSAQVLTGRQTGYAAMTGTGNAATVYDVATVTLPQLAARVAALQASLTVHGLIGT